MHCSPKTEAEGDDTAREEADRTTPTRLRKKCGFGAVTIRDWRSKGVGRKRKEYKDVKALHLSASEIRDLTMVTSSLWFFPGVTCLSQVYRPLGRSRAKVERLTWSSRWLHLRHNNI